MRIKKIISIGLAGIMSCLMLSGCMGQVAEVKINSDGSGTITASMGLTEEFINSMSETGKAQPGIDYTDTFTYNGITYYGEIQSSEFKNISELNEVMNQNLQNESQTTEQFFKIERNNDGSFTLSFDAELNENGMTGTEETIIDYDSNLTEEEIEEIINQMCLIFKIEFPTNVSQISGVNNGVKIEGNVLTIDLIEISKAINENTSFVFKTDAETTHDPIVSTPTVFTDVSSDAWYHDAVIAMSNGGLVTGIGDNKFNPDGTLTVAQFCQILARAKNLSTGADENGYWAAEAIRSCIEAGYVLSNGDITPANYDVPITRERAVAAMFLAKQSSLFLPTQSLTSKDIPDYDKISDEYKEDILNAYNYGITAGVDSSRTFNPQSLLTRGQVCQLFYNLDWTNPLKDVNVPEIVPDTPITNPDIIYA